MKVITLTRALGNFLTFSAPLLSLASAARPLYSRAQTGTFCLVKDAARSVHLSKLNQLRTAAAWNARRRVREASGDLTAIAVI